MIEYPSTALISNHVYERTVMFLAEELVHIKAAYPEITLKGNMYAQQKINRYYEFSAFQFIHYSLTEIKKMAMETFEYSKLNNFPFHPFETYAQYAITLNENCTLSSYTDEYVYSGGAHGNTRRSSASWDLKTGNRLELKDLFNNSNYLQMLLDEILLQAEEKASDQNFLLFDGYPALIEKYFDSESFYLQPSGITVYFQQYEIGPYVSGIIEFHIPYETLGMAYPSCLTY